MLSTQYRRHHTLISRAQRNQVETDLNNVPLLADFHSSTMCYIGCWEIISQTVLFDYGLGVLHYQYTCKVVFADVIVTQLLLTSTHSLPMGEVLILRREYIFGTIS